MSYSVYQRKSHFCSGKIATTVAASSTVLHGAVLALYPDHESGGHIDHRSREERRAMLFTLALILFVAWLLGLVGVYTIGSIVHVLLVIALVLFLVGIISGRRTVV